LTRIIYGRLQKAVGFVSGVEICVDLKLTLIYNIVLNKLINGMKTVCRTSCRCLEGILDSVRA